MNAGGACVKRKQEIRGNNPAGKTDQDKGGVNQILAITSHILTCFGNYFGQMS
jgi:hypothetical protein